MNKYEELKAQLPSPESYYFNRLKKYTIRGNTVMASCPFHKDTHPSLSLDLERGMFNCFSCGIKGGDIVDFEMKFSGASFKEALHSLSMEDL